MTENTICHPGLDFRSKNKTKDSNAKNKKIKTSKQFNSKCNEIIPFQSVARWGAL